MFSSFVGIVIVRCVQGTFCMQCDSAGFYPFERYLKYCRGAVDRIPLLTSRMPLGNGRFSIRLADSIATCKQFRQNCSVFRIVVIKGRRFITRQILPSRNRLGSLLIEDAAPKALITLIVLPFQPCLWLKTMRRSQAAQSSYTQGTHVSRKFSISPALFKEPCVLILIRITKSAVPSKVVSYCSVLVRRL